MVNRSVCKKYCRKRSKYLFFWREVITSAKIVAHDNEKRLAALNAMEKFFKVKTHPPEYCPGITIEEVMTNIDTVPEKCPCHLEHVVSQESQHE
jgi:hypothetical protein